MRLFDCAQFVGLDFFFFGFLPGASAAGAAGAAAFAVSSAMDLLTPPYFNAFFKLFSSSGIL
jgi:hypothetical protein